MRILSSPARRKLHDSGGDICCKDRSVYVGIYLEIALL